MKRLFAIVFLLFFAGTITDSFALTAHLTREYKCPRCKMKMERKGDCPCHKKKPTPRPVIHDPCGDDEGDFHISFDRLSAVLTLAEVPLTVIQAERVIFPLHTLQSYVFEVLTPPPQV